MKRQTLVSDNRNWYGTDLVSLQEEGFKILDSIFTQYGSFILSGCEVTPVASHYKIAPGLVALAGKDVSGNSAKMIVPFEGLASTDLPVYLTLSYEPQTETRENCEMKAVTYSYKAIASIVKPASGEYFTISSASPVRFTDAIQDENHQFVTPADRADLQAALDKKLDTIFDYVVDSDAKLVGLHNNPNITNVLIKKGTWRSTAVMGITLLGNVKVVVGEPGSMLEICGVGGPDNHCLQGSYIRNNPDYRIEGVTVKSTAKAACFVGFSNMTDCKAISTAGGNGFQMCHNIFRGTGITDSNTSSVFDRCRTLTECYGYSSDNKISGRYYDCKNLFHCEGDTITSCYSVLSCAAKTYQNSYASASYSYAPNYSCADTPEGGWNRTITA